MKTKFKELTKVHIALIAILLTGLALRLGILVQYGINFTLDSDDMGYVRSARTLLETGMLTYHKAELPTVHIMPGQPFLLAALFFLFGSGTVGFLIGKLIFIAIGTVNIYLVYKIGKEVGNAFIGLLSALLLALYLPQITTDNLFVTETPFMFCLLILVYYSIKLANQPTNWKYFFIVILSYLAAIMFKATFALYPFLLLIYFIFKKYPIRVAAKQFGVALILLLLVLGPWWARNYIQFGDFIPLTGGGGNPLLLGTYQGTGYLFGESYEDTVQSVKKMYPEEGQDAYFNLKIQQELAIDRIRAWYAADRQGFIDSYTYYKPIAQWDRAFYWNEVYSVTTEFMNKIHYFFVQLALYSLIPLLFIRRNYREYGFLALIVLYNLVLNSIYYAYPRYNQPLMFILFISISSGIYVIYHYIRLSYVKFIKSPSGK